MQLEGDKGISTPRKECQAISATSSSPVGLPTRNRAERQYEGAYTKSVVSRGAARSLYNMSFTKEPAFDDIVTVGVDVFNKHDRHTGKQESVHFIAGPYTLQFPLPDEDLQLLNYICTPGLHERYVHYASLCTNLTLHVLLYCLIYDLIWTVLLSPTYMVAGLLYPAFTSSPCCRTQT